MFCLCNVCASVDSVVCTVEWLNWMQGCLFFGLFLLEKFLHCLRILSVMAAMPSHARPCLPFPLCLKLIGSCFFWLLWPLIFSSYVFVNWQWWHGEDGTGIGISIGNGFTWWINEGGKTQNPAKYYDIWSNAKSYLPRKNHVNSEKLKMRCRAFYL